MKIKTIKLLMTLALAAIASGYTIINSTASDEKGATSVKQEAQVQKQEEWLKLENDNGFTIAYPSDWRIYVMSAPEDIEPSLQESSSINLSGPKNDKTKTFGVFQISVGYYHNKNDELPPKEYLIKHWENDERFKIIAERELIIAGEPAYEMTIERTRYRPFKHIRVKNGPYIYDITYSETTPDDTIETPVHSWPSAPIFEKILNSLEFEKEKKRNEPFK